MKQVTMRIEGFVTVTVPSKEQVKPECIPMKLDVFDSFEDPESFVLEIIETDITTKEITHTVEI